MSGQAALEERSQHEQYRFLYRLVVCLIAGFLGYGAVSAYVVWRLQDQNVRIQNQALIDCQTRKEGRDAVRSLVVLAIGDAPVTNPLVVRLSDSLKPGGALEQIDC